MDTETQATMFLKETTGLSRHVQRLPPESQVTPGGQHTTTDVINKNTFGISAPRVTADGP